MQAVRYVSISTRLHAAAHQMRAVFILVAIRTSNLTHRSDVG
jgi:hypothetical protein